MNTITPEALLREKVDFLQKEAKNNVAIMREFAGLENVLSETYSGRVIYELMQNADDCGSKMFHVFSKDNDLYAFNDGHPFTPEDLEALCRSTISNKIRSENIGYRGIGFKSVASICSGVSLISGNLEICFSRGLTKSLLKDEANVPLLRVPHWGIQRSDVLKEVRSELNSYGLKTCFVLHDANYDLIRADMENVDKSSIVFLRSLADVSIELEHNEKSFQSTSFETLNESLAGSLITKERTITTRICADGSPESVCEQSIRVWSYTEEVLAGPSTHTIDSSWIDISTDIVNGLPSRLSPPEANVQVFLPMKTTTGFGGRLNGDFDTDPSRTRLCLDEKTLTCIDTLVSLFTTLIRKLAARNLSDDQMDLLALLIPHKSAKFLDGIRSESLAMLIKEALRGRTDIEMHRFMLPVEWLDRDLTNTLCEKADLVLLSVRDVRPDDLSEFFGYLGAREFSVSQVFQVIRNIVISHKSACHLTTELFKSPDLSKQYFFFSSKMLRDTAFIPCKGNSVCSPNQINLNPNFEIDPAWLSSLMRIEIRSLKQIEFIHHSGICFSKLPIELRSFEADARKKRFMPLLEYLDSLSVSSSQMVDVRPQDVSNLATTLQKGQGLQSTSSQVSRNTSEIQAPKPEWRNMEEFAASYLSKKGYAVKDLSLRNVGYDLECSRDGKKIFVEVKKLVKCFDEFVITDNEYHVAREAGSRYWVLLVVQPHPGLPPTHVAVLKNFVEKHPIHRRCAKYENFSKEYSASFEPLA